MATKHSKNKKKQEKQFQKIMSGDFKSVAKMNKEELASWSAYAKKRSKQIYKAYKYGGAAKATGESEWEAAQHMKQAKMIAEASPSAMSFNEQRSYVARAKRVESEKQTKSFANEQKEVFNQRFKDKTGVDLHDLPVWYQNAIIRNAREYSDKATINKPSDFWIYMVEAIKEGWNAKDIYTRAEQIAKETYKQKQEARAREASKFRTKPSI